MPDDLAFLYNIIFYQILLLFKILKISYVSLNVMFSKFIAAEAQWPSKIFRFT